MSWNNYYGIVKKMRPKNNINILFVKNKKDAYRQALNILLQKVDQSTLLLLSGGTSPDELYKLISTNRLLHPGSVMLVDERFGFPMHKNSNEKMILKTGLVNYLDKEGIPFYGILKSHDLDVTAEQYEQTVKNLFKKFSKKMAIMGIGTDGHTAGIKPGLNYDRSRMVVAYDDENGPFSKRITLTFEALAQIDEFIILVFGEQKTLALQKMFTEKDEKSNPAAFYSKCRAKGILLTDVQFDL